MLLLNSKSRQRDDSPRRPFEILRVNFHLNSTDAYNDQCPIEEMTAKELAILPHYYVMPSELGMRDSVVQDMMAEETKNMRENTYPDFPTSNLKSMSTNMGVRAFKGDSTMTAS